MSIFAVKKTLKWYKQEFKKKKYKHYDFIKVNGEWTPVFKGTSQITVYGRAGGSSQSYPPIQYEVKPITKEEVFRRVAEEEAIAVRGEK